MTQSGQTCSHERREKRAPTHTIDHVSVGYVLLQQCLRAHMFSDEVGGELGAFNRLGCGGVITLAGHQGELRMRNLLLPVAGLLDRAGRGLSVAMTKVGQRILAKSSRTSMLLTKRKKPSIVERGVAAIISIQ